MSHAQQKSKHPADLLTRRMLEKYPDALRLERVFRAETIPQLRASGRIPAWCDFPMGASAAIIEGKTRDYISHVEDVAPLTAALIWRHSRMAYHFDDTLLNELANQPLDDAVPFELLYRLPYPCVYIDAPLIMLGDSTPAIGFFIWVEYDVNLSHPELRILYLLSSNQCYSFVLPFAPTLTESFSLLQASSRAQVAKYGQRILEKDFPYQPMNHISAAIQLALYLCSELDEHDLSPSIPRSNKRRTASDGTPQAVLSWDVGVRIGAAIRSYRRSTAFQDAAHLDSTSGDNAAHSAARPRPHMRRAHWHSFWTGSMKQPEERKLMLRWLPPIPVGFDGQVDENTVTTVVPVKK